MSKNQVNRIWPMVTSAIFGFIIAVIIFMTEAYSKNKNIYKILKNQFKDSIIGPLPCPIEKLASNNRYHILLKVDAKEMSYSIKTMQYIQDNKEQLVNKNVKLLIDIDSISVL